MNSAASRTHPRWILAAISTALFCVQIDYFAMNLALPEDEPGSLPGISNAAFGIGGSLGFAWAGTVVGEGTATSYHSALWICVAIGVAAIATSFILKPRTAPVAD